MYATLTTLLDRLESTAISCTDVIRWGCPVPSFGDPMTSRVASLGLNPSNREFVDELGQELDGMDRRFHTLSSLGLDSWSDVDARHLRLIIDACRDYFLGNPYDRWFKRLDQVVSGAGASFYDVTRSACHLDLIPYATARKWTDLSSHQRSALLGIAGDTLGLLLRESPVRILILNGMSVVENFQEIAGISLEKQDMAAWALPRHATADVAGFAYSGVVDTVGGIEIGHDVLVLGFNHNLQSSFGVTTEVVHAIRDWIAETAPEAVD
jgi:hypothetical protein